MNNIKMKYKPARILLLIVCLLITFQAHAQSQAAGTSGKDVSGKAASGTNTAVFPQWALDLRRGEIVAFGSFPFTFFFTSFFVDTYRSATHGWDPRYAPWPVKSAGAVDMTSGEQMLTIGVAAGSAVVIAVVDHFIMRHNRNKQQQQIQALSPGTQIIIRRPAPDAPDLPDLPD